MTHRIGFTLPFFLLLLFAVSFHPSLKQYLTTYEESWWIVVFSPQMFFLLATVLVLSFKKIHPRYIGITTRSWKKNAAIGFALGLIPYVGLCIANFVAKWFIKMPVEPIALEWETWTVISLLVFAPITEEFFFRGVIYHTMRENYGVMTSIVATSLLFAASHSTLMAGTIALGLINGYLAEKTKSLVSGIVFHAMSNGLLLFFALYCRNLHSWQPYFFPQF
jgi:membrane protease YdiL (CAAX protease family)